MRRILYNLHLVLGLTAGLLLCATGLSGSLLVFRPEIEAALEPGLHRATESGDPAPLSAVVAAATTAVPGDAPRHLMLAPTPDGTHQVWLKSERRVYVNPYTAAVRGVRAPHASPTDWLFALHTEFLSGERGERVAGWLGVGLLVLSISGVYLWWPSRWRQVADRLRVRWGGSGKRLSYDLHRTGGFYAAALLVLLALTGVSLAFGEWFTGTVYGIARSAPPAKPRATAGRTPLPLGVLLRRADAALPGGTLRRVTFPAKPGDPLIVRKRLPGDIHPNGMSYLYLDPATAAVLRVDATTAADPARRALNLRYPLHIGRWGGLATRLLHFAAGLAPTLLFVTGLLVWRTRLRARRRAGDRDRERRVRPNAGPNVGGKSDPGAAGGWDSAGA